MITLEAIRASARRLYAARGPITVSISISGAMCAGYMAAKIEHPWLQGAVFFFYGAAASFFTTSIIVMQQRITKLWRDAYEDLLVRHQRTIADWNWCIEQRRRAAEGVKPSVH